MKKNSPGCECCDQDCIDSCFWICANGTDYRDCQVCSIDIQLGTPDTVEVDPLLLNPEGCPDEAPCWACYELFDQLFSLVATNQSSADSLLRVLPGSECGDWALGWNPNLGSIFPVTLLVDGEYEQFVFSTCWKVSEYNCPYEANLPEDLYCNPPKILIAAKVIEWDASVQDIEDVFVLRGNEWDGSCGRLELVVTYYVFEKGPGFGTTPIPDPNACEDQKWSKYVHTFELNYCDCSDLTNNFDFVSTVQTDSCAGGVDDPCNFEEAIIELRKAEDEEYRCPPLSCFCNNCVGYRADQMQLDISGPTINTTLILSTRFFLLCEYRSEVLSFAGCEEDINFRVYMNCLPCDKFTARLDIVFGSTSAFDYYLTKKTEPFDCGDTIEFTETLFSQNPLCDVESHTFTLSFVPR